MDFLKKQFSAFGNRIRNWLDIIKQVLSSLLSSSANVIRQAVSAITKTYHEVFTRKPKNNESDTGDQSRDTEQGNNNREQQGFAENFSGEPNQESTADDEHYPRTYSKKPLIVRFWRTLLRRRVWHRIGGHPRVNWAEKLTVLITACILAVGLLQAYIYWRQAQLMESTLGQNERGVMLNIGQLSVANRNAKTAENTLANVRQDQRPWIHITLKQIHAVSKVAPSTPIFAWINIENTGKTPAESVSGCFITTVVATGEDPDFACTKRHRKGERNPHTTFSTGDMFPSDKRDFDVYILHDVPGFTEAAKTLITKAKQEAADAGDYYFVVHGVIRYRDVFGINHWTQFCEPGSNYQDPTGFPPKHPFDACFAYNRVDTNK